MAAIHNVVGMGEVLTLGWASRDNSQIHPAKVVSPGNLCHQGEVGHLLKLWCRDQESTTITAATLTAATLSATTVSQHPRTW